VPTLEETLLSVYRQSLIENLKIVTVAEDTFTVRSTAKQKLKQIDFVFEGRELRGLEQNPNTKSRWAEMARQGGQVMQFLEHGTYIAAVADGKVHLYPPR
jgi:hypothetical protein